MNSQNDFLKKIKFLQPANIELQGEVLTKLDILCQPHTYYEIIENDDIKLTESQKNLLFDTIKEEIFKIGCCQICKKSYHYDEYKEHFTETIIPFLRNSERSYPNESEIDDIWLSETILCIGCIRLLIEAESMKRKCFECGKDLDISECISSSHNDNIPNSEILKRWLNPIFALFCCSHYYIGENLFKSYIENTQKESKNSFLFFNL